MGNKTKSTPNKPRLTTNGILERRTMLRRTADQEVILREAWFRTLIENCMDGISILNSDGTVRYESPSVERILGYKPEELIGKNVLEFVHPDDVQNVISTFNDTLTEDTDKVLFLEVRFLHKDGSWHIMEGVGKNLLDDSVVNGIVVNYRDITERKQAEETRQHQKEWFRSLIENSLDAIVVLNRDGTPRYISPSSGRLLGYNPGELNGKSAVENVHPDDKPMATKAFAQLIDDPSHTLHAEVRSRHRDGSWLTIEVVGRNLLDDPRVNGIVVNYRDITERKQAENALRESEGKFKSFVEQMNDGYSVIQDSQIVFANARIAEMFGYTQGEVIGKDIHRFVPPETAWTLVETHAKRRRGEKVPPQYETVITRKDGTTCPIELSARLMEYAGRPATSVVVRDITERKQVEDALRESEEHYSLLVESLSDGVFHLRDGFVVWCNDNVEQIYGYTKDELIGKDINFFQPHETETEHQKFIQEGYEMIKEKGHFRGTTRSKAKDGSLVDIEYSISRIPGKYPIELVAVARNITEQKRIEEQLQLTGRLAAVGELAAGVAHELNNPLTAVQAFAQFLAEKKDLDDTIKDDIQTIYQESQRAARITSNLLSFARKRQPEKRLISINEVLDKSFELHSYRLNVNNIEVVQELHPSLPWTMADFHLMQQVFVNIINNAEQAMTKAHGKGRLIIKTQKKGNVIQITFSDDGPGISEEDLESIFDPFFTTKEVGEGTGLGLSICFGIVREHGGALYVKSKLGYGATFTVEIPIISEGQLTIEQNDSIRVQGN